MTASPAIPVRALGAMGIVTTCVGLGCAKFGSVLADRPREHWLRLARTALDLGVFHFDTANIYGQGDSERLLGEALRGRRHEVILASKGGQVFSGGQSLATRLKRPLAMVARYLPALRRAVAARRARALRTDVTAATITAALEDSLRRLGTDYVDLYYLHSPPVADIAAGEVFGTLDRLRDAGKLRCWGISCDTIEQAEAAIARSDVRLLQFAVDHESRAQAVLREAAARGVAVVARPGGLAFDASGVTRNRRLAELAARPDIGAVLIGTTQAAHLRESVAAIQTGEPQSVLVVP